MCNLGDDNIEDFGNLKYMQPKQSFSLSDKCNKCREETPCVVLRAKDKYCKTCFLAGVVHKFKSLLGKHKLIRPNDRVMILYKCGHPTTALLHFIRTGLDMETHKKLRFEPVVVFIENYSHLCLKERQEIIEKVQKEVANFNFPIYFASLTQLILDSNNVKKDLQESGELLQIKDDDKMVLDNFLQKQSNETNKNDFLNITMRQLWIEIAKQLHCKFIFTSAISIDVASQLLTDISLGKGPHVPLDTGFCDFRDDEVKILRPLRLFDSKELALYNYLHNLEPISVRIPPEKPYASIQNLMKKFVNDLQDNYPATVTTILKTGDKLSISKELTKKCTFCHAPFGENNSELTSAESTQFSHWVSTQIPDYDVSPQERYNKILHSFNNVESDNYCFCCKKLNK